MLIRSSKFFSTPKIARAVVRVKFVVFEKFVSAYYTKLLDKSCYNLLIIYMKKTSQEGKTD